MYVKTLYPIIFGFLISGLSFSQTVDPYTIDENTILLMHFDGNLNEEASNYAVVNHGIAKSYINNPIVSLGDAIYFDNSIQSNNSFISVPYSDNLSLSNNWTIDFWFNIDEWDQNHNKWPVPIILPSVGWDSNYYLEIPAESGRLKYGFSSSDGGATILSSENSITTKTWYHVALINDYDNNLIKLILRDADFEKLEEQSASYTTGTTISTGTEDLRIGSGFAGDNSFNGYIDELRISNVVRAYESTIDKEEVTSENLIIYYDQENGDTANNLLNQLQPKIDFYKKYFKYFFTDHTKIFSINICKDLTEFDQYKPNDLPDFETAYLYQEILYIINPTTQAQLEYFDSFEQAAMHGFAMRCVDYLYDNNAAEWMKYGFARHQAGMKSTPEEIRAEVSNLGRKPTYQEMYNWDEFATFDKYAFAYSMIKYISDVHSLDWLMGFIRFENNTTVYGFRQYNTEEKFNQAWHYHLDVFYLRETNLMEFQRESDHFYFYMTDDDALELDQFEVELETFYTRFTNDMQMTIEHKIHIFFYPEKCDYQLVQGFDYCDPNSNSVGEKLGIALAKFTRTYSDAPMMNSIGLAQHELTHVIHGNLDFEDNPAWLTEGLATLMPDDLFSEDIIDGSTGAIKEHVNIGFSEIVAAAGRYPTIDDFESNDFANTYGVTIGPYLLGSVLVDYIIKTSGYLGLKNFILSDGSDYTTIGFSDKVDFMNSFYNFYEQNWKIPPQQATAYKTQTSILIDGNISESDWTLEKDVAGIYPFYQNWSNNTTKYGVLWDDDYLYVAFEVLDNNLENNSSDGWNDGVEVFIDADFNKGYQYDSFDRHFTKGWNNSGLVEKNSNTTGVLHAVQNISGGFTVEMAIPWSNLGIIPFNNKKIGFDVSNIIDDNSSKYQLIWSGNNFNNGTTINFGELTLALNDNVTGILDLRENNSLGIPIQLDEIVTISGIVTASNDFGTNGPAYIQDDQAGIAVFGSEFVSLLSKGDSITITGKVILYNGLTELVYVEGESELVIHKNTNKPNPEIVSILDILNQTWDGVELLEGKLLQVDNVTFVESGTFSGNTNYQITDGTNYLTVRIDSDTGMEGMLIPTTTFSIVGCLSQFDNSEPYSTGYRILPRSDGDIIIDVNEYDWETTTSDNFIFYYTKQELYTEDLSLLLEKKFEDLDYTIYQAWDNINLMDRSQKIKVFLYDSDQPFINSIANVRSWDIGYYLRNENELHIKVPSTTRQLKYFSNLEKAGVSVLARYIMAKKRGNEPTNGLSFGFGLYESGYSPDLNLIQNYLDANSNTLPDKSTFNTWTDLDEEINVELAYTFVFASIFRFGYLMPTVYDGLYNSHKDIWYQIVRIFFLTDIEDGGMVKFYDEDDFIVYASNQEVATLVVEGLKWYANFFEDAYLARINHPLLVTIYGSAETYTYTRSGNINEVENGGEASSHSLLRAGPATENLDTELNRILTKYSQGHEFMHNLFASQAESEPPSWLNEGSAMYAGVDNLQGYNGINVNNLDGYHDYFWNDNGMYFPDLPNVFQMHAGFGYGMGFSSFAFIKDNFSKETLLQFMKRADDFSIIGYTNIDEFQRHLYEYLYNQYMPDFLFNPHWDIETEFTPGANFTFDWDGHYIEDLILEYSTDGMVSWNQIAEVSFSSGSYSWAIPNSTNCVLRFSDKDFPDIYFTYQILGERPKFDKVLQMKFENNADNLIQNHMPGRIKGEVSFELRDGLDGIYALFDGVWDVVSVQNYPSLSLVNDWTIQGDFMIENTTGVMNVKPVLLEKISTVYYKKNYSISYNNDGNGHLRFEYRLENDVTIMLSVDNAEITAGNWYTFYFARSVEDNIVEARVYDHLGNILDSDSKQINGEGAVLIGNGDLYIGSGAFFDNERCLQGGIDNIIISDSYHDALMTNDANNAPVVSDIPDQTIEEGSNFVTINLDDFVSDVDHTDSELTWTTNGEDELVVSISDNRVATISIPNAEWTGSEAITFTATDPDDASDSDDAIFTVTNVNDGPVVSNISDQTIDGGGSFTPIQLDDFVTDIDNDDSEITWSYSGNSGLFVNIDGNRVATITISEDWTGSETITFTATDPEGAADSNDAVFTVNPGSFTLPSNNFGLEVISETCPNRDNGQLIIEAIETHNYITTINGTQYSFTSDLIVADLSPGLYDFCISVSGENYQQCFVVEVVEGVTVSGKSSVSKNKITVEITKGTAPFDVMVNGKLLYKTMSATFDVSIKHGDVLNVKTSVDCEGVYSKTIELFDVITVYPNPSDGIFEIAIPLEQKDVFIEVYNFASLLVQSKNYTIQYGKVSIDLTSEPTGIYIAKIYVDNPINVKIIKN
jgi:Carbohydrate family 9 binding domain-like/Concanavalin A-like lectin/glucanases superfamily/Secretion system C-terminal sorting domain/Bacterial Ig domain